MEKFFLWICSFLWSSRGGAIVVSLIAVWTAFKLIFIWPAVFFFCYFFHRRTKDPQASNFLYLAITGTVFALTAIFSKWGYYPFGWFAGLMIIYLIGFILFIREFRKDVIALRNWVAKKNEIS